MATEKIAGIGFELTFDGSKMLTSINSACTKVRNKFQKSFEEAGNSATRAVKTSNDEINKILEDTERSAKSKAASIAAIYKRQGDSQEEAFKKAWSHIERDSSTGTSKVNKSMQSMSKQSRKVSNDIKDHFSGSFTSVAKKAAIAFTAAFSVKKIIDFGKECLDLGSDLQEVQNVVDVTFPSMTAKVDAFAKSAASSFGLSETMAKKFTGTFGAMAKSFGFSESAAYEMGSTLTGLAGDIASFYNITQDEAYTKLKSVFTGETESLKDLGVVMTQSALDSYALANGFGKTTQAMSEAEKVALRYQFVQNQLSAASGDFARTSGSWANQVRILNLQFESLKATIGQGLINLFTPVIRVINSLIGRLSTLANAFKAFTELITGKKSEGNQISGMGSAAIEAGAGMESASAAADNMASSAQSAGNAAKKAAKEMRSLMGFDQINKLSEQNTDSGSDGSTGGTGSSSGNSVDFGSLAKGETVLDKTSRLTDKLISQFKKLQKLFKKGFWKGLGDYEPIIKELREDIRSIGISLKEIWTSPDVLNAVNKFAENFVYSFGRITGSLANIGLNLARLIVGGMDRFLSKSKGRIKNFIVEMFDIGGDVSRIAADFSESLAEIFSAFGSQEAQDIVGDVLSIFTKLGIQLYENTARIGRDVFDALTLPFIENSGLIKNTLIGTFTAIQPFVDGVLSVVQSFGDKLSEFYGMYLKPFIDSIGEGLSSIFNTLLNGYNTYVLPVIEALGTKFTEFLEGPFGDLVDAVLEFCGTVIHNLEKIWNELLVPLIEWIISNVLPIIMPIIESLGSLALDFLGTMTTVGAGILQMLSGLIDFLVGTFTGDWEQTYAGLESIGNGFLKAIEAIISFIEDKIFQPFLDFIKGIFEKDWSESFGKFGEVLNTFFDTVEKIWSGIESIFNGIISFINNVFSGNWSDAWDSIVGVFSNIFGKIVGWAKDPINNVIGLINGLISALNSAVTGIENAFSFDYDFKNPITGTRYSGHYGLDLPSIPSIPYLAQGGFVQKNTPRLAVIGDNRHYGEITAPEDKMMEMAMAAARAVAGTSGLNRDDLEQIINQAVMRIISALSELGFYLDSEQMATAMRMAVEQKDYLHNPVIVK